MTYSTFNVGTAVVPQPYSQTYTNLIGTVDIADATKTLIATIDATSYSANWVIQLDLIANGNANLGFDNLTLSFEQSSNNTPSPFTEVDQIEDRFIQWNGVKTRLGETAGNGDVIPTLAIQKPAVFTEYQSPVLVAVGEALGQYNFWFRKLITPTKLNAPSQYFKIYAQFTNPIVSMAPVSFRTQIIENLPFSK